VVRPAIARRRCPGGLDQLTDHRQPVEHGAP
jgi:hypothetical protein